jgi:hypothetical protein
MTNDNLVLNKQIILAGKLGNKTRNELLNACLMLAKWHIYKTKLDLSDIFFYKFLCDIKYYLIIEKTIALRNNKLEAYEHMWMTIEQELT